MTFVLQAGSSILMAALLAVVLLNRLMARHPRQARNGTWNVNLSLGSEKAGLYTRAYIARRSTFALRSPETLYFTAAQDAVGKKLHCRNTYVIEGRDPDARWWSITPYKNETLIPNALHRYSFSKTTVSRNDDGSWAVFVSPNRQPVNWLPAGEPSGEFTLTLRVYGPGTALLAAPAKYPLPVIREVER